MARTAITWDDFSGGYVEVVNAGWPGGKNSWTGFNVACYEDGGIGPLPAAKPSTVTGVPNGKLWGLGLGTEFDHANWTTPESKRFHYFIVGNKVFSADLSRTSGTAYSALQIGTLSSEPEHVTAQVMWDDRPLVLSRGDGLYKVDVVADSVTKLTAAPEGTAIATQNGRVLIGKGNRIYWSAFNDPTTWGATDWVAIGDSKFVTAIVPLREMLLIVKYDGSLFALSGYTPEDYTVRYLGDIGFLWRDQAATFEDRMWALAGGRARQVTGASARTVPHLPTLSSSGITADMIAQPVASWVAAVGDEMLVFGSATHALVLRRGRWSYHQLPSGVSAFLGRPVGGVWLSTKLLLASQGSAGSAPQFWVWDPVPPAGLVSPANSPASSQLTFAPFFDPQGRDVSVEEVIVEFSSGTSTPSMYATLICTGNSGDTSSTQNFSPNLMKPSAVGSSRSVWRFPARTGPVQSFQLRLNDLAAVEIHRVTAVVDVKSAPGRGA